MSVFEGVGRFGGVGGGVGLVRLGVRCFIVGFLIFLLFSLVRWSLVEEDVDGCLGGRDFGSFLLIERVRRVVFGLVFCILVF